MIQTAHTDKIQCVKCDRGYYHTEFDTCHFNNIHEDDGPKQEIRLGCWLTPNILKALCFPSCPYNNTYNNCTKFNRSEYELVKKTSSSFYFLRGWNLISHPNWKTKTPFRLPPCKVPQVSLKQPPRKKYISKFLWSLILQSTKVWCFLCLRKSLY